jgi:hypothetical protein
MNISIGSSTSRGCGLARIAEVNEDQSTAACRVARSSADDISKACLVVRKNVVSTTVGKVAVEASEIILGMEDLGTFAVVDIEEL